MGLKWLMREVKNGFNKVEGGLDREFGEGHSRPVSVVLTTVDKIILRVA